MRHHVPQSSTRIAGCAACDRELVSPFPKRPAIKDPDGFGTFCQEIAVELGVDSDEITTNDIARAWARAMGWKDLPDGWFCPEHA